MASRTDNEPVPISMEEAVGHSAIDTAGEVSLESAVVLKHDRLYLLTNERGSVLSPGNAAFGLYQDDTRFLSRYELCVSGMHPALLSSQTPAIYAAQIDLAITDADFGHTRWDAVNSVHLRREMVIDDVLTERLTVTNFLDRDVELPLELRVASDFADIFEVRGWQRDQRGEFFAPEARDDWLCLRYRGRDGRMLRTELRFEAAPDTLAADGARWRLTVPANGSRKIGWTVAPCEDEPGAEGSGPSSAVDLNERRAALAGVYDGWHAAAASWSSDVAEFDGALAQAATDLRALYVEADGEPVISAGIPWYSTVFGRDSIITSLQALPLSPRIATDTLRYLAHHQGERENPETEEEPGKIMHELRRGEMARAGEIPHVPYYGTIDATPLWLVLLHETWRWTGDDALVGEMLPHAERALEWIDRYGDIDGDGFVEYRRVAEGGLDNQGWKDSRDGVPHPDGTLASAPIALVEVQGYVCDAFLRMAALFARFDRAERAAELSRRADALRQAIRERFWLDGLGTFALALDGEKRPVATATTNAGHLLWSRVPTGAQADRMTEGFLRRDLFSGWGLRTLSARHAVYNPMSYHNGSVWPHDNALVCLGMALSGHGERMLPVFSALHAATSGMPKHRLPELFCGMRRGHGMRPVQYPVSCSPQAWASGALFMLLQAATGILPDAPEGVLHVRQPMLPDFLHRLSVTGLQVGSTRVSLEFQRRDGRTVAYVLGVEGPPLQVRIEL
jgi:glycogen debranching enzyme